MGCAPSAPTCKKGGIRLMTTKLAFTKNQLYNLNSYFRKVLDEVQNDLSDAPAVEATVEKLVQHLMLRVSNLDRRFSSMFLVSLNEPRRVKQLRFEYLVRIDALSTPSTSGELEMPMLSVEEDASLPGFIRLKILGGGAEIWGEYMDVAGRLRRDLVKGKLANLLATAIKRDVASPGEGNVSISPGQVVDAEVLDKILKQPDHCRIFYGAAVSDESLPESRNHRVALIEDTDGILLRIGLDEFKACEIEVRLLIGIAVSSWPSLADYPQRVPLYHCDVLLHYNAAQSGMYAVAVGPYSSARCVNRATLWRIRVPAAEKIISQHYAVDSVPALTELLLLEILYELRERCSLNGLEWDRKVTGKYDRPLQDRLRVVSRHILRTVYRWFLERAGPDPLTSWTPDSLSRHVLLVLDELVDALKCRSLRCYFHPRCNVMLQCARGGIVHHEDFYVSDCRLLESYLETLHYRSLSMTQSVPRPLDVMESELIVRWRDIMASLPRGTTNEDYGYSQRQLEYLSLILEQVLRAKDASLENRSDSCSNPKFPELTHGATQQVGNLVFLLKLILTQARDQMVAGTSRRRLRVHYHRKEGKKGRSYNTTSHFDYSVGLLIDAVRMDRETANMDLKSFTIMTKMLLHWLHFGMDYDRKILEPILCPYLNNLFNSLQEYCWCATSWKKRQDIYVSEMQSLSAFCKSVITQEISPANGILDHLSAGWCWAESITKMIEYSGNSLRLIFLPRDRTIKYNLTFTENRGLSSFSTWSKARSVSVIARKKRMNSCTNELFDSLSELRATTNEKTGVAGHAELRDVSPLTYIASMSRLRARHRGPGDLISAMVSLGKFRVLQEVAVLLPREEQVIMLDMVHRVAKEFSRRSWKAIGSNTFGTPRQIYRPRWLSMHNGFKCIGFRPDTDLLDSSPRLSHGVREQCIVAEHQRQLEREMQEMHDSVRRNALTRQRPCAWDSHSVSSWSSSIDSIAGTITFKKYRAPMWEVVKGSSPGLAGLCVDRNIEKNKFGEMISREESPTWSTLDARRKLEDSESKNGDELPSWDTLEASLNRRLCNYGNALTGSLETDGSIGRNCVSTLPK